MGMTFCVLLFIVPAGRLLCAEDYFRKAPQGNLIEDPQGPESGSLCAYRVRCQCQRSTPTDLRPNSRCASSPYRRSACLGFRCARSHE